MAKNQGYPSPEMIRPDTPDFLGQDGDLADFELEMISGGTLGGAGTFNPPLIHPNLPL